MADAESRPAQTAPSPARPAPAARVPTGTPARHFIDGAFVEYKAIHTALGTYWIPKMGT